MKKLLFFTFALLFGAISAFSDPIGQALQPPVLSGTGTPEGSVTAVVGTLYRRTDGAASTTLYVKEVGSGNTGWVAYGPPGGSGAPATSTYITQTNDGTLTNEQALASLSTGIMRVATGTGVISALTDSAGIRANLSDESGTGVAVFQGGSMGAGTATTPAANDNDTSIATSAYVQAELAALGTDALITAAGFDLNLAVTDDTLQEVAQKLDDFVAPTGDNATAFFAAGQIERARGGTGADTSAYGDGLLGSNAAHATIDVDTASELSTAIGGETSGTGSMARVGSPTFTTQITTPIVVWTGTVRDLSGAGSPESVVTAPIGSVYRRTDGGAATVLYIKESGAGNTGWVAYGAPSGTGAPTTATYLTATADGTLSDEVVVGATPGGELGGTWASPTIDDSLSVTSWTLVTPIISGAVTFPDGVRQTFNPDATVSGLNVGAQAGNPSAPTNGDLWYNSSTTALMARINGANVALGAGGGAGDVTAASTFGVDNVLIKSDGTGKGVQATGITVDDSNNISGLATVTATATSTQTFSILDNVDQSHGLSIVANENLTANINLSLDLDGATRTMNIQGNVVLPAGTALVSGGALGTPSSGTLTNATGLPIAGITGLGANVGTWFATPSSANLIAALTDESGTGAALFGTSPAITTPSITGAITLADNTRQTFNPGATVAGLNVGSQAGDPSTPTNGDIWYDSTANTLDARINGATVNLGAGGGGAPTDATYITQTANGSLSAEQALSALGTGLMQVTTTTGVITSVTTSAGVAGLIGDETGSGGGMVFATSPSIMTPSVNNGATEAGYIAFVEDSDNGSDVARLRGNNSVASSYDVTLPNAASTLPIFAHQITNVGFSAARTITWPDAAITVARTDAANTFTGVQSMTSAALTTPAITGAATWQDGVRQTFNPDGTNAGLNVGSQAGDPSTPSNGDVWYDSTANELTARINGANIALGSGAGGGVENEVFGSAWNGDTGNAPAKDNVYDWGHTFDTDDDGLVNVLDGVAAAGFPYVNASGVVQGSRTMAEGLAIDLTNADGASGNPAFAFDPTELTGSRTWGDGSTDTIVWTFNRATGTDPTMTFADGIVSISGVAPLASPALTGDPTVPTATAGDSDTSAASTAFVQAAARDTVTGTHATPSTSNPLSPTWNSVTQDVWYGATGTINLPAAAGYAGRSIIIYNTGAFTITIDANASEVIVRDGTVQTGGVSMTLSTGAGNYVALICDGARWITLGFKGTLSVGS